MKHDDHTNNAGCPAEETPATQARITVIGVGNAGCNAVDRMARNGMGTVRFAAVSTSVQVLTRVQVPEKLILAGRLRFGLGTGGDPEQGRAAAEADRDALRGLCAEADIVFVVAGLGGGTGSGAAPVIAELARESGALVLSVVMLPFEWEGARRQYQAQESLQWLQGRADSVICVSNQRLFGLIDENTTVLDTFDIINSFVEEGVRSIWRLLTQPSLVPVDFADLCAVTRGRHAQSSLVAAESAGSNRSRDLVERLLNHPLLDGGLALTHADAVLVSLVGGSDLTMTEVSRVMEQIRRQAEGAHLIVGTAIDEGMGDRLHVTLIASQGRAVPAAGSGTVVQAHSDPVMRLAMEAAQEIGSRFAGGDSAHRSAARFAAPPPNLTPEQQEQMLARQGGARFGVLKKPRWQQGMLPLEIVSKGRFEKSEPTLYRGEDLDVPTYIRRGVALN